MPTQEIPISKVPPTFSSTRQIKFTNIDNEDFIHAIGGKKFKFKKGITVLLSEDVAHHFAKNLANKIIFKDDESKLKYAGIDEKLNREKIAKGESPLIKGVTQEVMDNLIDIILNHPKPAKPESEVTDIEEMGMVVEEEKKLEEKEVKKAGRPKKEESKEDEFPELD